MWTDTLNVRDAAPRLTFNVPADQIRTVRAYVVSPGDTISSEFTFRLTSLDEQRETDRVETRFDAPAGGS